jgi:hypothetical protein
MRFRAVSFLLILPLLVACGPEERDIGIVAKRVESRSELPGGPDQFGDEGDYLLANARIRAVVTDAGHSVSPSLWGGGLVDLDLIRPYSEYRAGKGLEQFFLVLPMINLNVPNPTETGSIIPLVLPDETAGAIRVTGRGDRIMAILNLMEHPAAALLGLKTRFAIQTDYAMEQGQQVVRITTTFRDLGAEKCDDDEDNDDDALADCGDPDCSLDPACPDWCLDRKCGGGTVCDPFYGDCLQPCGPGGNCPDGLACDAPVSLCIPLPKEMDALAEATNLVDVLSGGLISLLTGGGELPTIKPGMVAGDMVLFGANVATFVPDIGYEIDTQYRLVFLRGGNPLTAPPSYDFMAATGDRVSYAYFSLDGAVLFPFSTESLTGSMTHGLNCLIAKDDDAECDNLPFVRYTRYMAVGDGDVASVLNTIYAMRETEHGHVEGAVYDQKSMQPVSGADVYAIKDPCVPDNCVEVPDGCGDFPDYASLAQAARACSATPQNPDGTGMLASQFRTDRGMDNNPDGDFEGPLEPGTYYLVARLGKRPLSQPGKVEIKAGETERVALVLPAPALLSYRVLDEAGEPAPVRVTIGHCFPECSRTSDCLPGQRCDAEYQCRPQLGCQTDSECDRDERCVESLCRCSLALLPGEPREELGEGYLSDRKVTMLFAPSGLGTVELPPGHFDVIFSRGMEYSIDSREVELQSDVTSFLEARVYHVVDTRGYISVDQHIHGEGSADASITNEDRITSVLCDGLEFPIMTDHDFIQNLEPTLREMRLMDRMTTLPGEEISTLDVSHLMGWPLQYTLHRSDRGALNWVGKTPEEIFRWVKENGLFSQDRTVAALAHPRGGMQSYFDVYGLNPYTLELEQGMVQEQSPLLAPENFSPAFDMMEFMNSKRFDILRVPTWQELADYQQALNAALEATAGLPKEEILAAIRPISWEATRRFIERTPEQQEGIWGFSGAAGCKLPALCSQTAPCKNKLECVDGLCLAACDADKPCAEGSECEEGFCRLPANAPPCSVVKSLTDDWFRMLAFGTYKPGMGGSDVHGLVNYEMGSLRNYVRTTTDDPAAISPTDLIEDYMAGHSFATYGPFVEFSIDGKGPGETVQMGIRESVELRLRVQSPTWFDVSRVEILRNGKLEIVFDSEAEDPAFRIEVPNPEIVNLDTTLPVSPAEDSWYVAFVMGTKGRSMAPVYGSAELPPVYLGDIFMSVFGALPIALPDYIVPIKLPVYFPQLPVALTNPIFVDVDGPDEDGCSITPQFGPLPDWACNYPDDFVVSHRPCGCGGE